MSKSETSIEHNPEGIRERLEQALEHSAIQFWSSVTSVSSSTLQRMKRGECTSYPHFEKLAQQLGVQAPWLYGEVGTMLEEPPPPATLPDLPTIGARLVWAMKQREIRPFELVKSTGLSISSISHARKGSVRPSNNSLRKMAKALKIRLVWLRDGKGDWLSAAQRRKLPTAPDLTPPPKEDTKPAALDSIVPPDTLETFADRLNFAITQTGMNGAALARASSTAETTIRKARKGGTTPRANTTYKWAQAMGISFGWLLEGGGPFAFADGSPDPSDGASNEDEGNPDLDRVDPNSPGLQNLLSDMARQSEEFLARFNSALEERGWSRAELARQAKVSPDTLANWVKAGGMHLSKHQTQRKVGRALGVRVPWLRDAQGERYLPGHESDANPPGNPDEPDPSDLSPDPDPKPEPDSEAEPEEDPFPETGSPDGSERMVPLSISMVVPASAVGPIFGAISDLLAGRPPSS